MRVWHYVSRIFSGRYMHSVLNMPQSKESNWEIVALIKHRYEVLHPSSGNENKRRAMYPNSQVT